NEVPGRASWRSFRRPQLPPEPASSLTVLLVDSGPPIGQNYPYRLPRGSRPVAKLQHGETNGSVLRIPFRSFRPARVFILSAFRHEPEPGNPALRRAGNWHPRSDRISVPVDSQGATRVGEFPLVVKMHLKK